MPVVTYGRIGVTPLRLTTHLSLEAIADTMLSQKPNGVRLAAGWGSLGDDVSPLSRPGAPSPRAGNPVVVDGDGELPTRLEARAYWWEIDRSILAYVGTGEQRSAMRLVAADVFMSRVDEDELLVLVSTRNEGQLAGYVRPLLADLFPDSATLGQISIDTSAMDLIDPDFFLWLLYKSQRDPQVDDQLTIADMRALRSVDERTRATQVSRGVDLDRGEVLALIMQSVTRFGPAKVLLSDSGIGLDLDCEIAHGGEFSIFKKETGFYDLPEDTSEENAQVLSVLYFAHRVYPRLVSAWQADRGWHKAGRASFRGDARKLMRDATAD